MIIYPQNQSWFCGYLRVTDIFLFVKFRVECVEVLAVQLILNDAQALAEALVVDKFTLS